ncbi:MAG: FxsA family protein [Nocardioides sp.]|nr:FxsA family protein [Nocardioides sp.]
MPHSPRPLLAALVAVPLVELVVFVLLGQAIGFGWTVLALAAMSVVGMVLLRIEGLRALGDLRAAVSEGRRPGRELADGGLVVLGGLLLVFPGLLTSLVGLLLVLRPTRPLARRLLGLVVVRRLLGAPGPVTGPAGPATAPRQERQDPGHEDVVRGEVVDP